MEKDNSAINRYIQSVNTWIFRKAMKYLYVNIMRIEVLAMFSLFLFILMRVPYVNIVITMPIAIFVILIAAAILLRWQLTMLVRIMLLLFLLALLFTCIGQYEMAELIGNYIYALLWIIAVRSLYSLWKQV